MKLIQVSDEDHKWLSSERDRTGVPMGTQIKFMIVEKRKLLDNAKRMDKPSQEN